MQDSDSKNLKMTPLQEASSDELLDELGSRFDDFSFVGFKNKDGESGDEKWRFHGETYNSIWARTMGLLSKIQKDAIKKGEW